MGFVILGFDKFLLGSHFKFLEWLFLFYEYRTYKIAFSVSTYTNSIRN